MHTDEKLRPWAKAYPPKSKDPFLAAGGMLWLAKVGYERMQEMSDPARSLEHYQPQSRTDHDSAAN